jgi:FkbM family methyltransferase
MEMRGNIKNPLLIKHFEIKTPSIPPPEATGWEQAWHGYYEMAIRETEERKRGYAEQDRLARAQGQMTEAEFERDIFLSILADIKKEKVNMFELGAGWGRMSLTLAGAIDHKIIPMAPSSYQCLAIEAEPSHYKWLREHFEKQGIKGVAIQGAAGRKNGTCSFDVSQAADNCYGQGITPLFSKRGFPSISNIQKFLKKKTLKVPMYNVDRLIHDYKFTHVDIIDVDVQGAEYDVIRGASQSISNGIIDYWLIGTHAPDLNEKLKKYLSSKYDIIVNIYPDSLSKPEGFAPVKTHDGIQLYKRKGF